MLQTLSDPVRRSIYDELIGVVHTELNPFLDGDADRNEVMPRVQPALGSTGCSTLLPVQVFVDEFSCIGCRNCNCLCPSTFGMEEEYGRARAFNQGADAEEDLQDAIDSCPVSCIHWPSLTTVVPDSLRRIQVRWRWPSKR